MTLRSYQCAKCEHTWTGLDGHCHLCGGAGQQMESTLDRAISEGLPASEILDLMKEEQQVDLDRALTFLAEGWSDFLKKKSACKDLSRNILSGFLTMTHQNQFLVMLDQMLFLAVFCRLVICFIDLSR